MSEAEVIVRAENLSKVYRLYSKPQFRFLDMFGLLRKDGAYTEHSALRGIELEIRRGEKVAFIGRNGAGKSTLLKLISGVIEPTAGTLQVSQGAHALLQIGSGFHQDFTGRQNALAYLAHLGVSGAEASRHIAEIVEFAELEEYIDQPIKTYSTGMVARLMFATSTVIEPELLVLDEILGVGDAYFSQKSFERIREMCEANGTTVLLVSHDIYSAARLCERMIWIDQGQVVFDGPAREAMRAYETSIREQEEKRLRAKKLMQAREQAVAGGVADDRSALMVVEISSGEVLDGPVDFQHIRVGLPGLQEIEIPLTGDDAFMTSSSAYLVDGESNWGEVREAEGVRYREMRSYGSPYNKVAFVLRVPATVEYAAEPPELRCSFRSGKRAQLQVTWFDGERKPRWTGELPGTGGDWALDLAVPLSRYKASTAVRAGRSIGTHRVTVHDVRFVDDSGQEVFFLQHGASVRLLIDYQVNDGTLRERPQVVVAIHRDGSLDTCRFISRDLFLDGALKPSGTIEFRLERMPLSNGRYTVTVLIAREGYYDEAQTLYFTINPGVYACRSRVLEFEVTGGGSFSSGTVFVGDAGWALSDGPLRSRETT